jgi:hypothetical protein
MEEEVRTHKESGDEDASASISAGRKTPKPLGDEDPMCHLGFCLRANPIALWFCFWN